MDCWVLPARPSRKEPGGRLERWPRWRRRAGDPEVVAIARRRKFSGSEKRRLLSEADRCKEAGTLGAFLRRERIYSSMITSWRKQVGVRRRGGTAPKRRGPKPDALGTASSATGARQRPSARQARARRARSSTPKKTVRGTGAADSRRQQRGRVMLAVAELTPQVGLSRACRAFALNRGLVCRDRARRSWDRLAVRATGGRGHGLRWHSRSPSGICCLAFSTASASRTWRRAAVFATLLDEGRYHGSIRTMYRAPGRPEPNRASAGVSEPIRPYAASLELLATSGPTRCGPGISAN